jgi:HEAT repeat protein
VEELMNSIPSPKPNLPQFPQDPLIGIGDLAGTLEGYNRWEFWFEIHKDILLRSRDFRRREILNNAPPPPVPVADDGKVRTGEAHNLIAPALREALKSTDPRVVRQAALGLGRVNAREAVSELEELSQKGDAETQRYAILALGMMDDRAVLSKLVNVMIDPQAAPEVRAAAALGVGLQGRREGARFLRDFVERTLNSETAVGVDKEVFIASTIALGMCRDRDTAPLLIGRYRMLHEGRSARSKAIEVLLLNAMGRVGDPSALITLLEALNEKDEQLRRSAAQALGDLGDRAGVKALAEALEKDHDEQTRGFAAISLGRLGGEAARDALRAAFTIKSSRTVKAFSALGLGLLGDRAFSPEILKALQQPSEEDTKGALAISLGLLQETKAVETLMKVVETRGANADFRGYCAIAIGMIRPEGVLDRMLKILEEDPDKVDLWRRALCLGVGLFGQPKAAPALVKVLREDSRAIVREHAALALNLCRGRNSIQMLTSLIEKEQMKGDIALFSVVALGGLGDRFEYPLISEAFFNVNYRVRNTFLESLQRVL